MPITPYSALLPESHSRGLPAPRPAWLAVIGTERTLDTYRMCLILLWLVDSRRSVYRDLYHEGLFRWGFE